MDAAIVARECILLYANDFVVKNRYKLPNIFLVVEAAAVVTV